MASRFVHLHLHTEYSMLDGLSTVDEYVARATKLKMPAMAITDHGNMCGAAEFYKACKKANIEPIIGQEFYFVPDFEEAKASAATKRAAKSRNDADPTQQVGHEAALGEPGKSRYHVVILARGREGYRVLSELSTAAFRNFYYKPLLDRRTIEQLDKDQAQNLVVLSGCAASIISQKVLNGDLKEAGLELAWWRDQFPNFYIEIQHHKTDWDWQLNKGLLKLAKRYDLPHVITNDPHYALKEDCGYHDALLAIQTASDIDDPNRFRFDGTGYHLRADKEIRRAFADYKTSVVKRGIENTFQIAQGCHTVMPEWDKQTWRIPPYPDADDSVAELRRLAKKGLRKRGLQDKPEYVQRMKDELRVIESESFSDFLLITRDIIKYAQKKKIPVGPGRGSVCGTLVGYLIDIHRVDPVRYGLLFERFLNPARPSMPDIDTDFGPSRRDEVFNYITKKYGRENVLHVAAYQNMKLRSAFKSLAKAYGITFAEANRISQMLPENIHGSWRDDDEGVIEILNVLREKEPLLQNNHELMNTLQYLAGRKRAISIHPAGVIIADPKMKIRQLVPEMFVPSSSRWVAQFNLKVADAMGLLKEDILGLRTLETIDECVRLIERDLGEKLDVWGWVPDEEKHDADIYQMLAEGRTAGVFQMEGRTNTRGIQEIGCEKFEDIVSCTSLYRTGPIDAGFPEAFIRNRRRGHRAIKQLDKRLQPILAGTEGVILYQEQVMEIGRVLANFNMEQVDDLKDAIKKKESSKMQELEEPFFNGCRKNGIKTRAVEELWQAIKGYSGYSFNRSHAVAYSLISYVTARLKYLYPLQLYTALLMTVSDKDKRVWYLSEALESGIKVLPPHINRSAAGATCHPDENSIRFGFTDIAGIGDKMAARIVESRPEDGYADIEQVSEAVRNIRVVRVLEQCTALDDIGGKGSWNMASHLLNWVFKDRIAKYRKAYRNEIVEPSNQSEYCCIVGQVTATHKGVTKNDTEYMTWTVRYRPGLAYKVRLWRGTEDAWSVKAGDIIKVEGKYDAKWEQITVNDADQVRLLISKRSKKR